MRRAARCLRPAVVFQDGMLEVVRDGPLWTFRVGKHPVAALLGDDAARVLGVKLLHGASGTGRVIVYEVVRCEP